MTKATQQLGTPQRHGAGWFVPSGQVGYFVERLEGRWRMHLACKHILWVRRWRNEVLMQG